MERGTNDVYKLANFYNGRILKNFVHVDKLKSCQSARAVRSRRPITIINTQHGTNGRELYDGPPTVGYNTCGSQDHRTHERDPLGQTTRKCMSKPQETSQAGATAGTDNETNDLRNAFGNAEFNLAFESELVCERGIPGGHNDSDNTNERIRHRKRRGTPHFRYRHGRPTRTGRNRSPVKRYRG